MNILYSYINTAKIRQEISKLSAKLENIRLPQSEHPIQSKEVMKLREKLADISTELLFLEARITDVKKARKIFEKERRIKTKTKPAKSNTKITA